MHFINAESRISEVFGFVSSGNGTHKISVRETVRNMWRSGIFFRNKQTCCAYKPINFLYISFVFRILEHFLNLKKNVPKFRGKGPIFS